MRSTTTYERGRVVVVEVPFSNGSGVKPRPALIVSDRSFHDSIPDLIVCPISSQPRYHSKPGPGDCPIQEWLTLKLHHASTVRVSKMLAVDKAIIKRKLGVLSTRDMATVEAAMRSALKLR